MNTLKEKVQRHKKTFDEALEGTQDVTSLQEVRNLYSESKSGPFNESL